MQNVTYKFSLSEAGQKAAILAGLSAEREQSLQIPASAEALALATIAADGSATVSAGAVRDYPMHYDAVPTAEQVEAEIVAHQVARDAQRAANFAAYDVAITDPAVLDDFLRRMVVGQYPEMALPGTWYTDQRAWAVEHADDFTAQLQAMREIMRQEQRAKAEAKAEAEAARAAREAEEAQARIDAMRAWAEAHRSTRLAKMMELQVGDWMAVAEDEFFAAHTPDGYSREAHNKSDTCADRRRPTEAELAAYADLLAACSASDGVLSRPRLQHHTIGAREDEDGEWIDASYYVAVDVDITAPTGRTVTIAKIIE